MTPLALALSCPVTLRLADDLGRGGRPLFPVLDQDVADAEQGGTGDDEQGRVGERQAQADRGPGPADGHHVTSR